MSDFLYSILSSLPGNFLPLKNILLYKLVLTKIFLSAFVTGNLGLFSHPTMFKLNFPGYFLCNNSNAMNNSLSPLAQSILPAYIKSIVFSLHVSSRKLISFSESVVVLTISILFEELF